MPGHDIIVIGASAGGVQTLVELVGALPRDLPASVFIVIHVAPFGTLVTESAESGIQLVHLRFRYGYGYYRYCYAENGIDTPLAWIGRRKNTES